MADAEVLQPVGDILSPSDPDVSLLVTMMADPDVLQPLDTNNLPASAVQEEENEETDQFAIGNNGGSALPVFDLSMLNMTPNLHPRRNGGTESVATTADLASDVGSVVMMPKEAFMKSFTFYPRDNINWGITFGEQQKTKGKLLLSKNRLPVVAVNEDSIFSLSRIRPGDYLKTINGKTVGPSMNGERALAKMQSCLEKDKYLTVVTKNKEEGTDDILVHATIIKPKPGMSLSDLGMTVWIWGFLCVKEISRDSIFRHTALKENDNIVSINEIVVRENVSPEQFAHIVKQLPQEITITILRRKQRSSGAFK